LEISKLEQSLKFFHRFKGSLSYVPAKAIFVQSGAFKSLNETISTGSSSRRVVPAGILLVSYVIDTMQPPE